MKKKILLQGVRERKAAGAGEEKRRRSDDQKERCTKNGSNPLRDDRNVRDPCLCGSSGDARSEAGLESDFRKLVLPYGKRCLEHRFYRR